MMTTSKFNVFLIAMLVVMFSSSAAWARGPLNPEQDIEGESKEIESTGTAESEAAAQANTANSGADTDSAHDTAEAEDVGTDNTVETETALPSADPPDSAATQPENDQAKTQDNINPPTGAVQVADPVVETSPVVHTSSQLPKTNSVKPKPVRTTPRKHLWLIGGGGSYGFFSPRGVNQYLEDWVDAQGDYTVAQEGDTDMVISFIPHVSVSYSALEYFEIEAFVEAGWAPKIIEVINGETDVFHFLRLSPGVNVMGHIPFNRYQNSIFFGPGVEVDWMKFEEFNARSIGFRGTVGGRFYLSKMVAEAFGTVLVTKADSNAVAGESIELAYTSFLLGASFYGYLNGK